MYLVELGAAQLCFSTIFTLFIFMVLNKLGMAISTFILESGGLA